MPRALFVVCLHLGHRYRWVEGSNTREGPEGKICKQILKGKREIVRSLCQLIPSIYNYSVVLGVFCLMTPGLVKDIQCKV